MSAHRPYGSDWSGAEIDLILADYFDMLGLELAGESFNKAARNRALQELTGRTHRSIEFKHQNISAVLQRLGLPWIRGYRPADNFQRALIAGVDRYLSANPAALHVGQRLPMFEAAEATMLFVDPPPVLTTRETEGPEPLRRLVRKFDPAARDARNRELGRLGEEHVLRFEHFRLTSSGRSDLARKIRWVSEQDGDGAGYDISSFDLSGGERLIEVKTTTGAQATPFFITENERSLSEERPGAFRLMRVYDFARTPRAYELEPPLERFVSLAPVSYRATPGPGIGP